MSVLTCLCCASIARTVLLCVFRNSMISGIILLYSSLSSRCFDVSNSWALKKSHQIREEKELKKKKLNNGNYNGTKIGVIRDQNNNQKVQKLHR